MSYILSSIPSSLCFFFNDTATTEIYTLSLHDALPISYAPPCTFTATSTRGDFARSARMLVCVPVAESQTLRQFTGRSEEHTSELQSRLHLVCRLLLEKKKNNSPSVA